MTQLRAIFEEFIIVRCYYIMLKVSCSRVMSRVVFVSMFACFAKVASQDDTVESNFEEFIIVRCYYIMLKVSCSRVMSCVVFVVFLLILLRLQIKMTQLRATFEEFIIIIDVIISC